MTNYTSASAEYAESVISEAGHRHLTQSLESSLNVAFPQAVSLAAATPGSGDLNDLLNSVGEAPGTSTVVTVPAAPVSGDAQLLQNMQTLDSYIAVLTALVMYNNHPDPYNLADPKQAAQFVIDTANARNFVVTGGTVKALPMYLPMGEASTQSISKSTTSADLHVELLSAMFETLSLTPAVLKEIDGILTQVADTLKNLKLSFSSQSQTLNHFVSFYHLTPVEGANPPLNKMDVDFLYLQLNQRSWEASVGKSSVKHFGLDFTLTRTKATMSAGLVAANTSSIVNSLLQLTGNDAATISKMTGAKGVKTGA